MVLMAYLDDEFVEWAVEKILSDDYELSFCPKCGILDEVMYKEVAIYDIIREETTRWTGEIDGYYCPNCEKEVEHVWRKDELLEWLKKFAKKDPEGVEAQILKELLKTDFLDDREKREILAILV